MSTVTDPIADLLARVRNGARAQKLEIFVPYSKLKAEVIKILKSEGYISEYEVDTKAEHPRIKITNKLVDRTCAITGLNASAVRVCGDTSAPVKFHACLAEWARRFYQPRVASCPAARRKSRRSAANCSLTFGEIVCRELEISRSTFLIR